MSDSEVWKAYNLAGAPAPARPRLVKTLETFFSDAQGKALDLGCGGGRDTRALLSKAWAVDAVDSNRESARLMTHLKSEYRPTKLRFFKTDFKNLQLEESAYDLINASYSLPFCHPSEFPLFWRKILSWLKPNGILSCELFGTEDSWAKSIELRQSMTFFTQTEVEVLFSELKTEFFDEERINRTTFTGALKHWHSFTCISRKPQ